MEAAIFLGAVAVIVVIYFIAKEFERIAGMKGHMEKRYFWWSFLLSWVGWLMVIALPDRSENREEFFDMPANNGGHTPRSSFEDQLPEL